MSAAAATPTDRQFMQCMEIFGGNRAIETGISVPGIDAWVVSQPHAGSRAGGDIHYISLCGSRRIARFVVADVAGHGDAVGELAVTLRSLMRKHINRVDQTRFVRTLNEEFAAMATDGAFATAVLATYFSPIDRLIICNAGHPRPLFRRNATGVWTPLDHDSPECAACAANLPLGVVAPTEYYQFAVPLEKGDLVLLYTDALVEASDPHGRHLGEAGLLEMVRHIDPAEGDEFCRSLLGALAAYRGGAPPGDDVTLLLLHHNGANPAFPSAGDIARVVGKLLGLIKV